MGDVHVVQDDYDEQGARALMAMERGRDPVRLPNRGGPPSETGKVAYEQHYRSYHVGRPHQQLVRPGTASGSATGTAMTQTMDDKPTRPREAMDLQMFDYELVVRQQPKQARICSSSDKQPKGPVDPPPVIRLQISQSTHSGQARGSISSVASSSSDGHGPAAKPAPGDPASHASGGPLPEGESTARPSTASSLSQTSLTSASLIQSPYLFCFAALCKPDDEQELYCTDDGKTKYLAGNVVSSLYHLRDPKNGSAEGFFVFPDIGIRVEGTFRLKMSLYEMVDNAVYHCKTIFTDPFEVYSMKRFPGVEDSTELSKSFASQGLKMRIKGGPARTAGKSLDTAGSSVHKAGDSPYSIAGQSVVPRRASLNTYSKRPLTADAGHGADTYDRERAKRRELLHPGAHIAGVGSGTYSSRSREAGHTREGDRNHEFAQHLYYTPGGAVQDRDARHRYDRRYSAYPSPQYLHPNDGPTAAGGSGGSRPYGSSSSSYSGGRPLTAPAIAAGTYRYGPGAPGLTREVEEEAWTHSPRSMSSSATGGALYPANPNYRVSYHSSSSSGRELSDADHRSYSDMPPPRLGTTVPRTHSSEDPYLHHPPPALTPAILPAQHHAGPSSPYHQHHSAYPVSPTYSSRHPAYPPHPSGAYASPSSSSPTQQHHVIHPPAAYHPSSSSSLHQGHYQPPHSYPYPSRSTFPPVPSHARRRPPSSSGAGFRLPSLAEVVPQDDDIALSPVVSRPITPHAPIEAAPSGDADIGAQETADDLYRSSDQFILSPDKRGHLDDRPRSLSSARFAEVRKIMAEDASEVRTAGSGGMSSLQSLLNPSSDPSDQDHTDDSAGSSSKGRRSSLQESSGRRASQMGLQDIVPTGAHHSRRPPQQEQQQPQSRPSAGEHSNSNETEEDKRYYHHRQQRQAAARRAMVETDLDLGNGRNDGSDAGRDSPSVSRHADAVGSDSAEQATRESSQ